MTQLLIAVGMGCLIFGWLIGYLTCAKFLGERIDKLIEDRYEQDCELALLRTALYGRPSVVIENDKVI